MRRISLLPARRLTAESAVAQLYDRAAHGWQAGLDRIGYDAAYRALCAAAQDHASPDSPVHVLDVGTGTGVMARAFAANTPQPCQFDLLDISAEMLQRAQVSGQPRLIEGAIGTPDIAADSYDRVLCGHVIEHCADPDAALRWLHARLKPGGSAILSVSKPHWCTALVRWKYGSSAYTPERVETMLQTAGFTNIHRQPYASGPPGRLSCGYIAQRPIDH